MNDKRTHTPGPWQYRPNEYDDWGYVRALPLPGENIGDIVAVAKDSSVPSECYAEYRKRKADPFEANARLIAAAPELLAELQRMVEHFGTWASDRSEEASTETWAALYCAKAAISKAEPSQS
jgi:hypothetical protein